MARAASVYSCRASSVLTSVGRERATSTMIFRVMRPVGLLLQCMGQAIAALAEHRNSSSCAMLIAAEEQRTAVQSRALQEGISKGGCR